MKTILRLRVTRKRIAAVGVTGLSILLASCGGGHDDNNAGNFVTSSQPDSFFGAVNAVIATSSDTIEPVSSDTVTATAPEQNEPAPLS